jgi:DNA-binding CsgD family transcriptional regulator
MQLNAIQTRQLSKVLETLTLPGDSVNIRQRLVEPLANLLNADYVASLVWDESAQRFGQGVSCRADAKHVDDYQAQYQFSDPLPGLLRARRYPTLVTQVIPQRELVNSDFFNRFLRPGLMYWGLNVFAHDGQQDVGDLRIWRCRGKGNFDTNELEILRLIYPSLVNALSGARQYGVQASAPSAHEGQSPISSKKTLPLAIDPQLAYQHGLSQREAQIAHWVAQGLSDKEIAKAAGIAFTTVRTYLSQTFKKTACANRKELIAYLCSRQH